MKTSANDERGGIHKRGETVRDGQTSRDRSPTVNFATTPATGVGRERDGAASSPAFASPQRPSTNPEITLARALNDTTKALEKRVGKEVRDSRANLRNVFESLQHSQSPQDIDFKLKTYLRLKADARATCTYLRDTVLVSFAAASAEKARVGESMAVKGSQAYAEAEKDRAYLTELDLELIRFETAFDSFEETADPEKQLRTFVDLMEFRDKALFRLCMTLLHRQAVNSLGFLQTPSSDNSASSGGVYMSKDLPMVFQLLNSFKFMADNFEKLLAAARPDDYKTAELATRQKHIHNLEAELQAKQEEYAELSEKLELINNAKGRLQKISQQQEEIMQLTSRIKQFEITMDDMREQNRKMMQSLHIKTDRLVTCEAQLTALQKTYETGVKNLEPLVREQVTQTQIDQRDIQALRYDVSMGVSRAVYTDRRLHDVEIELSEQKAEVERLAKMLLSERRELRACKQEVTRLNKVNIVVVAAKVSCENLAKEHMAKSAAHAKRCADLESAVETLHSEMGDMEAYIVELQAMVTRAEESAKLAEDQLNLQVGSIEVRDHFVAKLKQEIEAFKKMGITPEKKVMWDQMEDDLWQARQLATQTGKQLKALTMRVHELSDQIVKEQKLRNEAETRALMAMANVKAANKVESGGVGNSSVGDGNDEDQKDWKESIGEYSI